MMSPGSRAPKTAGLSVPTSLPCIYSTEEVLSGLRLAAITGAATTRGRAR
jgi:hypothetical protein